MNLIEYVTKNTISESEFKKLKQLDNSDILKCNKQQESNNKALNVYKQYQSNILKSSQLQTAILKGIEAGEDVYNLFLKAIKAISLMVNDELFYKQVETDLKAIYGIGLINKIPLKEELKQTMDRLKKLQQAGSKELNGDVKERILKAIAIHKQRIAIIENKLNAVESI